MPQAPPERDTHTKPEDQQHAGPPQLSQSDPTPETTTGRPPIVLIIVIVLLVLGFVVLHLTGVVGPGTH